MANPKADELKARTKRFALDVLSLTRNLPSSTQAADIGRQLSRSATGVAANYRAACRSRSDAEFLARVGVVLEEADESLFWMEVLIEGRFCCHLQALALHDEANQLTAIFAASIVTVRRRLESGLRHQSELNLKSDL
jgi:four helix bundle protein